MANVRLLEDGVSRRLLENDTDVRILDAFEPETFPAIDQLASCFRNVRNRSLYKDGERKPFAGNAVGAASEEEPAFDPAVESWAIRSERTHARSWVLRETADALAWLSVPVPMVGWNCPDVRMGRGQGPRPDTNPDVAWMATPVPISGWTAPTDRMDRVLARWTPEVNPDHAWMAESQPVVEAFDGALFPAIAELVGQWTPASARVDTVRSVFLFDLSWVHDVIPLTETPPVPFINLRPIAPIMNRRRRRRR